MRRTHPCLPIVVTPDSDLRSRMITRVRGGPCSTSAEMKIVVFAADVDFFAKVLIMAFRNPVQNAEFSRNFRPLCVACSELLPNKFDCISALI